MVMKIHIKAFLDVALHTVAVGYQRFRGPCCLQVSLKHWYPTTTLRSVTTQNTT